MSNSQELKELLDFALELANLSAGPALAHFRQKPTIDNKDETGFDPVTSADRGAEEVMRRHIERHLPEHGIHGEEFGIKEGRSSFTWVLDPIDGTRAYICGMPTWMTLIGLMYNDQPVLGVAHQPFVGETFYGSFRGAFLKSGEELTRLEVRPQVDIAEALIGTTLPDVFKADAEKGFLDAIQSRTRGIRYGGDAYFYSLVAAGQMDVAMDAGLAPYDIVALIPIIEGAGGRISTFSGDNAANGGNIIASAGGTLHEDLLAIWREHSNS